MRSLTVLLALLAAAPIVAQQADSARVYDLSEVQALPVPRNADAFRQALHHGYPPQLRAAGVGGTVEVSFVVGPDGTPADVQVLSTPDSAFDVPTRQAVSLLRFTPAEVDGRPVPVRVVQPITWQVVAPVAAGTDQAAGVADPVPDSAAHAYELAQVDVLPRVENMSDFQRALAAEYPAPLLEAGTTGTVTVRFRVETDGSTSNYSVTHSTNAGFDQATLRVLPVLRFRPARLNGQPVRVWVDQPIEWRVFDTDVALDAGADAHEQGEVEVLPRPVNLRDFQRALREERPSVQAHPGVEAEVQVRFRMNEDGTTSDATVTGTSDPRFNMAALRAVQVLRFTPARVGRRPVKVWVDMPISFAATRGHPNWQELENGARGSRARREGSPSFTTPTPR